ncbi:MAG TPA: hypothetical protein VKT17_05330 [Acidobacteriota bacterium]|nr:hypothetical protein [Acidobacteriota bacterium]
MKASKTIGAALAFLFIVSVIALSVQAAPGPQKGKQEPKAPAKGSMPKEIAAVIQEGLATRQGRQDIPFSFVKQLILPAQQNNLYPVFFFKAKNGDLGYAPSSSGSGQMETNLLAFFEFYQPDAAGALKPKFGGRSQTVLTTGSEGYSADKEDWYSFGLALPSGKYTLALVLSTPDMKKLSVGYSDVTLPGPEAYETTLWPTDPIIVTAMDQVEPDQRPTIHRGYFTWGAAKIATNSEARVASGENLEVLFFVLGATSKDPAAQRPVLDLEVNFEVQDEAGKAAIKWAPQSYELYLVNQPLPLFQTLQKMDEKGTVLSTDKKPLPAGKYTLAVTVLDKVGNKKGEAKMAFTVI